MNLSDLQESARQKADEESTGFIDNDEVTRYLNQGLHFIYGKIAQRFEDYFVIPGTVGNGGLITTVSGTQAYSLPTTMIKAVRVEHRPATSTDDNEWRKVRRVNLANDRIDDYYPVREGYIPGFGYHIAGNKLYLRPVPASGFSVRMWFVPRATELAISTDVPEIPSEYHEVIADYAARRMLAKSGEGIWQELREVWEQEVMNLLETIEVRNQEPEQMTIYDDDDFDHGWGP